VGVVGHSVVAQAVLELVVVVRQAVVEVNQEVLLLLQDKVIPVVELQAAEQATEVVVVVELGQ